MSRTAVLVVALVLAGGCDGDDAAPVPNSNPATTANPTATTSPPVTATVTTTRVDESPPSTPPPPTPPPSSSSPPSTARPASAPSGDGTAPGSTAPEAAEPLGPLGDTELEIETDQGSVQIGSGTVPPSAEAIPVPDDLEVTLASEADGSAGFSGTSAGSVDEIADFYRRELPAAGFEIVDERDAGPAVLIVFARPGDVGQVAISDDPVGDGSTVVVAFGPD